MERFTNLRFTEATYVSTGWVSSGRVSNKVSTEQPLKSAKCFYITFFPAVVPLTPLVSLLSHVALSINWIGNRSSLNYDESNMYIAYS